MISGLFVISRASTMVEFIRKVTESDISNLTPQDATCGISNHSALRRVATGFISSGDLSSKLETRRTASNLLLIKHLQLSPCHSVNMLHQRPP
jgi:hypothetical protein